MLLCALLPVPMVPQGTGTTSMLNCTRCLFGFTPERYLSALYSPPLQRVSLAAATAASQDSNTSRPQLGGTLGACTHDKQLRRGAEIFCHAGSICAVASSCAASINLTSAGRKHTKTHHAWHATHLQASRAFEHLLHSVSHSPQHTPHPAVTCHTPRPTETLPPTFSPARRLNTCCTPSATRPSTPHSTLLAPSISPALRGYDRSCVNSAVAGLICTAAADNRLLPGRLKKSFLPRCCSMIYTLAALLIDSRGAKTLVCKGGARPDLKPSMNVGTSVVRECACVVRDRKQGTSSKQQTKSRTKGAVCSSGVAHGLASAGVDFFNNAAWGVQPGCTHPLQSSLRCVSKYAFRHVCFSVSSHMHQCHT